MDQLDLPNSFQLMLRRSMFLVGCNKTLYCLSAFRLVTSFFFLSPTVSCIRDGADADYISKVHDLFLCLALFVVEICTYTYRAEANELIEILLQPINVSKQEATTVHLKILKDYFRETNIYCKKVILPFGVAVFLWFIIPLVVSPIEYMDENCLHVPIGWVWQTRFHSYLLTFNILGMYLGLWNLLQWFLLFYCMVIKVKCSIQLICLRIMSMDDSTQAATEINSSPRFVEDVSEFEAPADSSRIKSLTDSNERELKKDVSINGYINRIVEEHVISIRTVKHIEKTYRFTMMICVQLGMLIPALAIPQIIVKEIMPVHDLLRCAIEVIEMLGCIGLINYFGQMLFNQSKSLRQTIYSCDWTDKPRGWCRELLIMQTVASRPLETYSNVLSAVYSYTSLIQTLEFKKNKLEI